VSTIASPDQQDRQRAHRARRRPRPPPPAPATRASPDQQDRQRFHRRPQEARRHQEAVRREVAVPVKHRRSTWPAHDLSDRELEVIFDRAPVVIYSPTYDRLMDERITRLNRRMGGGKKPAADGLEGAASGALASFALGLGGGGVLPLAAFGWLAAEGEQLAAERLRSGEKRRGARRAVVDAYVNNLRVDAAKEQKEQRGPAWNRYQDEVSRLVRAGKVTPQRASEVLRNAEDSSPDELTAAVAEMRRKYGR
jgi:hypothetical protein